MSYTIVIREYKVINNIKVRVSKRYRHVRVFPLQLCHIFEKNVKYFQWFKDKFCRRNVIRQHSTIECRISKLALQVCRSFFLDSRTSTFLVSLSYDSLLKIAIVHITFCTLWTIFMEKEFRWHIIYFHKDIVEKLNKLFDSLRIFVRNTKLFKHNWTYSWLLKGSFWRFRVEEARYPRETARIENENGVARLTARKFSLSLVIIG